MATMDIESIQDGTLLYIGVEEGKAVPVDTVIAVLGKAGEDNKSALEGAGNGAAAPAAKAPKEETKTTTTKKKKPTTTAAPKEDTSKFPASVIRLPLLSETMTEGG